jgi:hypothetical protein
MCLHPFKSKTNMKNIIVLWYVFPFMNSSFVLLHHFTIKEKNTLVPVRLNQVELDANVDEKTKRHNHATKQLTAPQLVKLLGLYSEWLGGDEAALAGLRVARLAQKSISSYTSNVRRFFVYLHVRKHYFVSSFVLSYEQQTSFCFIIQQETTGLGLGLFSVT